LASNVQQVGQAGSSCGEEAAVIAVHDLRDVEVGVVGGLGADVGQERGTAAKVLGVQAVPQNTQVELGATDPDCRMQAYSHAVPLSTAMGDPIGCRGAIRGDDEHLH
jgi:hypothetical protein